MNPAEIDALNRRYFRNRVAATITYGPHPKARGPRKSIKMGSYSVEDRLIRANPCQLRGASAERAPA